MSVAPKPKPKPKPAPAPGPHGKPASPNQAKIVTAKQSAQAKGISTKTPAKTVCEPCDRRARQIARHEYCEIASLTLTLTQGKQTKPFTVSTIRRREPVAPTAYRHYRGALQQNELVIEALADVEMRNETTAATQKALRPLDVELSAKPAARHSSFGPPHPYLAIAQAKLTSNATPIKAKVYAPSRQTRGWTWLSIWPFSAGRTLRYDMEGTCCGIVAKPPAKKSLAMHLVVLPHEEWSVTIGVPNARRGYAKESGQNLLMQSKTLKMRGATTAKRTDYMKGGSFERSTEQTKDHYAEKTTLKINHGPLGGRFIKDEDSDSTIGPPKKVSNVAGSKLPLVKLTMKSGGVEYTLPGSDILQGFLDAEKIVDKFVSLLSSFKFGWGIKVSKTFLDGELAFGFGYRWPMSYTEENRVYYVERYLSAKGSIILFKASVEGMAGFEFDPWYLPGNLVAKIYLSLTPSLKTTVGGSLAYKNPDNKKVERADLELSFEGLVTLEFGAQAGGRWRGESLSAKLAVVGSATLTASGKCGFNTPPQATAKAEIGQLKIIGEVINTSASFRKQISPIILVEKRTLFDRERIW